MSKQQTITALELTEAAATQQALGNFGVAELLTRAAAAVAAAGKKAKKKA